MAYVYLPLMVLPLYAAIDRASDRVGRSVARRLDRQRNGYRHRVSPARPVMGELEPLADLHEDRHHGPGFANRARAHELIQVEAGEARALAGGRVDQNLFMQDVAVVTRGLLKEHGQGPVCRDRIACECIGWREEERFRV